jgi:hypothetical protein
MYILHHDNVRIYELYNSYPIQHSFQTYSRYCYEHEFYHAHYHSNCYHITNESNNKHDHHHNEVDDDDNNNSLFSTMYYHSIINYHNITQLNMITTAILQQQQHQQLSGHQQQRVQCGAVHGNYLEEFCICTRTIDKSDHDNADDDHDDDDDDDDDDGYMSNCICDMNGNQYRVTITLN